MLQKNFYHTNIKNVAIHHFGGLGHNGYASTQSLTLEKVNNAHQWRWPHFPSELNPTLFVGYNAIIWPDGSYTQCRFVGEETAAVIGNNRDTLSICLAGNFNVGPDGLMIDKPTKEQTATLQKILEWAFEDLKIPLSHFKPHRGYNATECYGSGLADDWGRKLLIPHVRAKIGILEAIIRLYLQLLKLSDAITRQKEPLASVEGRGCNGSI